MGLFFCYRETEDYVVELENAKFALLKERAMVVKLLEIENKVKQSMMTCLSASNDIVSLVKNGN